MRQGRSCESATGRQANQGNDSTCLRFVCGDTGRTIRRFRAERPEIFRPARFPDLYATARSVGSLPPDPAVDHRERVGFRLLCRIPCPASERGPLSLHPGRALARHALFSSFMKRRRPCGSRQAARRPTAATSIRDSDPGFRQTQYRPCLRRALARCQPIADTPVRASHPAITVMSARTEDGVAPAPIPA